MRNFLKSLLAKSFALVSFTFLISFCSQAQTAITMSTANCTITENEVQMDIQVPNTSPVAILRFNSTVIRMTVPAAMIPAGTQTYSFNYIGGSEFPLGFPVAGNPSAGASFNTTSRLLTWTTGSAGVYNNISCPSSIAIAIDPGQTRTIGRFSFKITSGNFVPGADATFTWSTTSSCNFYVDCAPTVTAFNQASGFRTLAAPCALTVPSACTSPTVDTNPLDQVTCTTGNAVFNASFTGGSPASTLIWQVQTGGAGLFSDLTETAPYSGTTTGTLTITNPSVSLSTNRYRLKAGNTCGDVFSNSALLTVNSNVTAGTVSGTTILCTPGQTAQFTSDGTAGGTWSSSDPSVATVNAAGLVTIGASPSSSYYTDITYTVNTGCGSPVSSFRRVYAYVLQSATGVFGPATLCSGASALFQSDPQDTQGGEWNSTNTSVATVDKYTGLVTAVGAGSTNITYTAYGCLAPGFATAGKALTVDPAPNAGTVTGVPVLCAGNVFSFSSNGDAGGTWSSSNAAIATVNATTGEVKALASGTADINYTVNGCTGSQTSSSSLTVNALTGTLAGVPGEGQSCKILNIAASGTTFTDASCNLIATIIPSGLSPVSGPVNTCVTVDPSVQVFQGNPYVQRHYDIEPSNDPAGATATVTLYFTQADFDAYNLERGIQPALPNGPFDATGISNLLVTQYHGIGTAPGNYTGDAVLINPVDANIIWNSSTSLWEVSFDVVGFSGFYVYTSIANTPLPVTLLSFNGKNNGSVNALTWSTSAEQNSDHFEVERSINGADFVKVANVTAAGNSSTVRNYHTDDNISGVNSNIFYYRLKMVDINGAVTYSSVVSIRTNGKGLFITAVPNPFVEQLNLQIVSNKQDKARLSICDVSGRSLSEKQINLAEGSNVVHLNGFTKMAAGVYILRVQTSSGVQSLRVVKQ